jgi:hypothetical protein
METQFQSSFIPKKPIVSQGSIKPARTVSIVSLVAIIVFVVSLLLSGGVVFWEKFLVKKIASEKQSLERAKDAFDPLTIETLERVSGRIESSKKLLASHTTLSPLFDLVETLTLKSVRFRSFDFAVKDGEPVISMKGQAESFSAVALQADVFGKSRHLNQPVLSDLELERDGRVSFSFTAGLSPELITFTRKTSGASQGAFNNNP